ncbi:hypothetical protein G7L40_02345 [Paenibacillus polymyxa]|uniref:Uncharacterized protein n=1 Tax=Paenibacillus polymyxa TaxID=1406 RepID=A0A378XTR5_PAEPO|nr:hypothetical protein [Paenibacillus polymyxa]MBE7897958.1 hypothetical protein [Paenibacillus polymyxa]MBG9764486.1 hypothetical protein [Paenibacillus polymyxa]MCC3259349.1 hypothetical protein [Paenibacillus polymyxa]QPK51665.1 hypothetical protein G7035_02340 [Paenibacillus polymyxa]QPK56753.1 hypothetical protein G7L40_02345 [Paenibacillus polymyxa]
MFEHPTEKCPYCSCECHADWVDTGFGHMGAYVQCGPYYCQACGASEIGAYDNPRELSEQEEQTGWYKPGSPVSDKANTYNGKPVDHKTAKEFGNIYETPLEDTP